MVPPYALVVEDDPDTALVFQRALQDAGFQAEVVPNSHKAQARLAFTTPDLVFLDLHLPRQSGKVVLRQIRGQNRLEQVRVIITTGEDQQSDLSTNDADYVLVKPVEYGQVRELAASLLLMTV